MKTIFAFLLVVFFTAQADAQWGSSRPMFSSPRYAPSYRQSGFAVSKGSQTYFFQSGRRQPSFSTYSNRNYGRSATHVFQGNRYRGSIYAR